MVNIYLWLSSGGHCWLARFAVVKLCTISILRLAGVAKLNALTEPFCSCSQTPCILNHDYAAFS